jgi:hypothetical protein
MLRAVRVFLPLVLAGASTVLSTAAAAEEPFLRGPHPFRKDNALSVGAGYGLASGFHGVAAALDYGYQIAGSLWLDLRFDMVDAQTGADRPAAEVATFTDVLGGIRYKLQTDIPLVPYAGAVLGPVFLFHEGAAGAFGLALRVSAGAKYFLFEWLGLGVELGGVLGGAVVDEAAGLSSSVRLFDLGIGAEIQF